MPYNKDKGYNEPAETREDLAKQTAEAARGVADQVHVDVAGADALVEAAKQDLSAVETNEKVAEARQAAQDEADAQRAG